MAHQSQSNMVKHLLQISDVPSQDLKGLIHRGLEYKRTRELSGILGGKCLVLLFEKASTRTRMSFEVAVQELGGATIFMTPSESQLGRSEPLKDTARVASGYVHGLIVRTFAQSTLDELAQQGTIPIINALSDRFHPCQVLSDLLTISAHTPDLSSLTIAWVGDGNNMVHSWINAACFFPFELRVATPKDYAPDPEIIARALDCGARLYLGHDPAQAVQGADYINTDAWFSMGQEDEEQHRQQAFQGFQVNADLVRKAKPEAGVLHCLPAHRGQEITDEVIEGRQSLVWEQAANRLPMQKALLEWIYSSNEPS